MSRTHQAFLGAVGAVGVALLIGGRLAIAGKPTERNYEFLPDMVEPVAYDGYSRNAVFPDGKTLREPVAGTVARGALPIRDARALPNPFTDSPEVLERGRRMFQAYCAACHGPQGTGDGPVTKRGVPPPPSLSSDKVRAMKDGELFQIMTAGQGNMPPHAAQVARDDRWKIARFVRTLKGGQP